MPPASRVPSTRIERLLAATHDFSALSSRLRSPVSTTMGSTFSGEVFRHRARQRDRRSPARGRRSPRRPRPSPLARFVSCGVKRWRPSSSRVVSSRLSIMRKQPLAVLENAPAEPFAVVVARAQHERLGRELNARERALELVRHGREKVLLPPPQLRVMPQRPRQHGHAADQHDEEEAAFPEHAVDARVAVLGDGGVVLAKRCSTLRAYRTGRTSTSRPSPPRSTAAPESRSASAWSDRVSPSWTSAPLPHSDSAASVASAARRPSASLSMSRRVCASDRNAISNADGASAMPWSSSEWKMRA